MNKLKAEDQRNYFMINRYENYVSELGFELATPESAVRLTTDCTMEHALDSQ